MDYSRLGNFIARRRRELGMTQKVLAEKLHVTDKAISKWETGKGLPDLKLMGPLAEALGVTLYELMEGEAAPVSPQNPLVELSSADQVVRQAMDYSKAQKKKTKGQKIGIVLLAILVLYLGCFAYDNFVPGQYVYTDSQAAVYEADGTVSGEVKVFFHGKLKNCLLPYHMDAFVGTVRMKLPEMEYGEFIHVWLYRQKETPQAKTGEWLIYPTDDYLDDLLSTMEKEVVFTEDLREFAIAFEDGRIVATSEELYSQLKEEIMTNRF